MLIKRIVVFPFDLEQNKLKTLCDGNFLPDSHVVKCLLIHHESYSKMTNLRRYENTQTGKTVNNCNKMALRTWSKGIFK